jgi:hypothetical protein
MAKGRDDMIRNFRRRISKRGMNWNEVLLQWLQPEETDDDSTHRVADRVGKTRLGDGNATMLSQD